MQSVKESLSGDLPFYVSWEQFLHFLSYLKRRVNLEMKFKGFLVEINRLNELKINLK